MVDITPPLPEQRQLIQSYGGGGFRIAGVDYTGSVLIEPEQTHAWPVTDPTDVRLTNLAPLVQAVGPRPPGGAVLLLGTGADLVSIDKGLRSDLRGLGIGLEVMGTGAACRTFNVLLAEERTVIAALISVS